MPSDASPISVGILLFPDVEELDFVGPWEVLSATRKLRPPGCHVVSVATSLDPITAANGLRVLPDFVLDDAPTLDVLIVPGGPGVLRLLADSPEVAFIKHHAQRSQVVASVCTGAFLLERAGLLNGKKVATHHLASAELMALGTCTVVDERVVDEWPIVTSAGVSAGMDMAVYLIERLFDGELASQVARRLELPIHSNLPAP